MIKQIQLRGISHRPSDRMTADGGLEECIDLRLEEQEQTVAKAPVDVTDELAPGLSTSGIDVLFIHKTNTYTNYVGKNSLGLAAYVKLTNSWSVVQIATFSSLSVVSMTSIGNMLIYSLSDGNTYYALCKDNSYVLLGAGLPRPSVEFFVSSHEEEAISANQRITDIYNSFPSSAQGSAKAFWDYVMVSRNSGFSSVDEFYNSWKNYIWNDMVIAYKKQRLESGYFSAPVLVRYALKMRDGSYVNASEPIMLTGAAKNQYIDRMLINIGDRDSEHFFCCQIMLANVFSVLASVQMDNASYWSDLIESVDVFVSTEIMSPKLNSDFDNQAVEEATTMSFSGMTMIDHDASVGYGIENNVDDFEEKMLEKGNFYLLKSFPIMELPASSASLKPVAQDDLVVSMRLEDSQAHTISGYGKLASYNERLVTGSQMVVLSPGHAEPQAAIPGISPLWRYEIVYFLRDDNGEQRICRGYSYDNDAGAVRGFVSYPDARCYKAELYVSGLYQGNPQATTIYSLPMKEHPRLDVAYGFWGLDDKLDNNTGGRTKTENGSYTPRPANDAAFEVINRLALSEMDNPFVFPLGQRLRFTSEILDAVPVTTALSTGQFGQFPLYVFTRDGIYSVSLNDEGGLAASHPLSRDVAIEGTIAQLDQAIVFVSKQGVMIVQGSQVSCLSPFMNGPQYTIKDIAPVGSLLRSALTSDGYGSLLTLSLDTTMFQDFAEGSKPLYDYENKRILLFNSTKNYVYECELDSQTWRKHSLPDTFTRVLNGYPSAYSYLNGKIYEWSVRPDFNAVNPTARKGWILTRPFDLGEPDIRKVITAIRVRGAFNHPDVKCILLGSMNGHDWQRLTSMRGGSYKSFRLLLLTNLTPGERISWVDVEYDVRFANKLR